MSLANIASTKASMQSATLELENPFTGEPLISEINEGQVSLTFLPAESAEAERRVAKAMLAVEKSAPKKQAKPKTVDQVLARKDQTAETKAKIYAALATGWENVDVGGEIAPFSTEAAEALFTAESWICDQIDAFLGDATNFIPAPKRK